MNIYIVYTSGETLLWQKQLISAPFYLKSILLLLISATLLYLSTIPSYKSVVGKGTGDPETSYCLWWKLFATPHLKSSNARNLCFFLCFMSLFRFFSFIFWSIETTTAICRVWLTQNPSKRTNQVTQSNKYMNHLFWA